MVKFQKIYLALFITGCLLLAAGSAQAARLYFEPDIQEMSVSEIIEISLMLDAREEQLNAVEGWIFFSENLKFVSINEGNSLIGLWVQKPIYENGRVIFSGIVPGGYKGILGPYWEGYRPGEVFKIIFEAEESGLAEVGIENAKTLLNDGEGTETAVSISNLEFLISKQETRFPMETEFLKDTEPPEAFISQIARDSSVFDGKYFLVFNTQDKGSGIYYYKVKEGNKNFEIAESPYLLKNQRLYDNIIIQAIDKSGNIREEKLPATNTKPFYLEVWLWIIIIFIAIFLFIKLK